jgi:hypothetical protein
VRSGQTFAVEVEFRDESGDVDTSFNGPVTLSLASRPSGGSLSGDLTVNAVDGVARFTGISANRAGRYVFRATTPDHPFTNSGPMEVTASKLDFSLNPSVPVAESPFDLRIFAQDETNNTATNFSGTASWTLLSAPAGAVVSGPRTTSVSSGVGTFSDLEVSKSGDYRLRVTVGGLSVIVEFDTTIGRKL